MLTSQGKHLRLLYLQQEEDSISHIPFHSEKYEEKLFSIKAAMMLNKFANTGEKKKRYWTTE